MSAFNRTSYFFESSIAGCKRGIVGIVGSTTVTERLVEGLRRLEYRGYDSAGVAIIRSLREAGVQAPEVRRTQGIVENFAALKRKLEDLGYKMASDTDTELIAHLIYDVRKKKAMPLEEAVRQALTQVHGAFGLGVV